MRERRDLRRDEFDLVGLGWSENGRDFGWGEEEIGREDP